MTSSTWTFETAHALHSCGIDAERIDRFAAMAGEDSPMPLVFAADEVAHAGTRPDPAATLCICFCAKEAVLKALETPYDLTGCRVFPAGRGARTTIFLDDEIAGEHGISTKGRLEYRHDPDGDEVVAAAYLFEEERH
jgi:phosphopantetheinyl transferase (holo-ACP synthase)